MDWGDSVRYHSWPWLVLVRFPLRAPTRENGSIYHMAVEPHTCNRVLNQSESQHAQGRTGWCEPVRSKPSGLALILFFCIFRERDARHDLELNIFPFGPPTQSISIYVISWFWHWWSQQYSGRLSNMKQLMQVMAITKCCHRHLECLVPSPPTAKGWKRVWIRVQEGNVRTDLRSRIQTFCNQALDESLDTSSRNIVPTSYLMIKMQKLSSVAIKR